MKKKIKYCSFIVLIVIVVCIIIPALFNPLGKSEEEIKSSLLELTPMGTNMEEVIKVIQEHKKWEVEWIDYEKGFMRLGLIEPDYKEFGRETIYGEKSIKVFMGEYRNPFGVPVEVFYGFDKDSKLMDIYIRKDGDVL